MGVGFLRALERYGMATTYEVTRPPLRYTCIRLPAGEPVLPVRRLANCMQTLRYPARQGL